MNIMVVSRCPGKDTLLCTRCVRKTAQAQAFDDAPEMTPPIQSSGDCSYYWGPLEEIENVHSS